METKRRDRRLDCMKGIAILCVVVGHVIDGATGKKMFADAHWMNILYDFIYVFHMPLFFFLSGISFAMSRVGRKANWKNGGVLNLLILYLFWSTMGYLLKNIFSAFVNVTYKESLFFCFAFAPVDPYWYLIVLLWYYLIGDRLRGLSDNAGKILWVVSIILGIVMPIFLKVDNSIFRYVQRILYHFVFFWSGVNLCRIKDIKWIRGLIAIAAIVIIPIGWFTGMLSMLPGFRFLGAIIMIYMVYTLVEKLPRIAQNSVLAYMGENSIYIYVLHNFVTVAFRTVYNRMGISINAGIYVVCNVLVTILACALAERIASHIWPLDIFFHPCKTIRKIKLLKTTTQ